MAKRKNTSSTAPSAKRCRSDTPLVPLTGVPSVVEQAQPYLLTTAKFPIQALTPVWKVGSNRPLDTKHVRSLYRIFKEQGLQRELGENHLRIACSRTEVDRMLGHLKRDETPAESLNLLPAYPSFDQWVDVNGTTVEIMAGQHRVEALKLFLEHLSSRPESVAHAAEQSWWICDIYDIGESSPPPSMPSTDLVLDRLPPRLRIQLRANRPDSTLPDSHGQVWMELVALAEADHTLFQGTNGSLQDEMLQTLGLSNRVQFPMRRLVTLWKNDRWRQLTSQWCRTSIGRATFNVSLWEEMARCRIDEVSHLGSDLSSLLRNSSGLMSSVPFLGPSHNSSAMTSTPSNSPTGTGWLSSPRGGPLPMSNGRSIRLQRSHPSTRFLIAHPPGDRPSLRSLTLTPTIKSIRSSSNALTSPSRISRASCGLAEHRARSYRRSSLMSDSG